MKKWVFGLLLLLLSSGSIHAGDVTAYHKLRGGETLYFLAQVYYNDGNQYGKILAANNLPSPESIAVGEELIIPDPQWLQTMPKFGTHYQELAHNRNMALSKKRSQRSVASEPVAAKSTAAAAVTAENDEPEAAPVPEPETVNVAVPPHPANIEQ